MKYTEEQFRELMQNLVSEWERDIANLDYNMDPDGEIVQAFGIYYAAEVGFIQDEQGKNSLDGLYFSITIPGYNHNPEFDDKDLEMEESAFHGILYDLRFKIFELLETQLWPVFVENSNNNPCSFQYKYDTDHLGYNVDLEVRVTDYYS